MLTAGGKEHREYPLQSIWREQSFRCDENEPLGTLSIHELSSSVNKATTGRSELPSINQLVQEWLAPENRRSGSRSRLDQNRYPSLINNCLWVFISFSGRE